jgi:hypothetical protein
MIEERAAIKQRADCEALQVLIEDQEVPREAA